PPASVSGCEAADFKEFERGAVALIRRGTCQFQVKVDHAAAAGAIGAVIMNEGVDGRVEAFSGQLTRSSTIPVVGISYELGRAGGAQAADGAPGRLAVNAEAGKRPPRNVLADTGATDDGPLVVVGAHLDSVPEGPGINDNGSGSAAVLEAALQLAKELTAIRAHVQFAFWGAEERGLIGSRHHVAALSDKERGRIAIYVNLDMVGSPNFARSVQDTGTTNGVAAIVRRELLADFREHKLPVEERSGGRRGGSD